MFLEPSDFSEVPYRIPNLTESPDFQDFIDKKEAEYLKKVLGLSLYNDFVAGLNTSGDIDELWTNLRDGATYTVDGQEYEYLGVKDFLKPVVYSQWLEKNYRKWSNGGMVVTTAQNNSTSVNPIDEIVENWNKFVKKIGVGYQYWYNCYGSNEGTLRGYMDEVGDDYESWDVNHTAYLGLRNTLDL